MDNRARFARLRSLVLDDLETVETHISCVYLAREDVFKVKKPVDFGFLDFTTVEKRRRACEDEVRLNSRLSPDVYLGVVPVYRRANGWLVLDCGDEAEGDAAVPDDWAVHMRRLPDAERADDRHAGGRLGEREVDRIANRLADFHAEARCDDETSRFGCLEVIEGNVVENFEQIEPTVTEYVTRAEVQEIEETQIRFLAENESLFRRRIEEQRVRDGHGDLRLDHVYIGDDGALAIIDCIEFNDRFRFADVCADIAFLAMDLTWHGHPVLAERFLASYAQASNDYHFYPLVDFYESYRAFVRGKISSFAAHDAAIDSRSRERAARDARRFLLLALAAERRRLVSPVLYVVAGPIASGKSTLARALATALAVPVVDADHTRKWLLGVAATDPVHVPAFSGAYTEESSRRTYDELFDRARSVLRSGRSVVLDASFRSRELRRAAHHLARAESVPLRLLECRAPRSVLRKRLEQRERETSVSDGRLEILDDFLARWQTVDELTKQQHVIVDTTRPLSDNLEELKRRFKILPQQLP